MTSLDMKSWAYETKDIVLEPLRIKTGNPWNPFSDSDDMEDSDPFELENNEWIFCTEDPVILASQKLLKPAYEDFKKTKAFYRLYSKINNFEEIINLSYRGCLYYDSRKGHDEMLKKMMTMGDPQS